MSSTPEAIEARLAVMEYILAQILATQFFKAENKEAILAGLRASIDKRFMDAPSEIRRYAVDCLERVFSSAVVTAKELSQDRK